jgi:hypothetical protein
MKNIMNKAEVGDIKLIPYLEPNESEIRKELIDCTLKFVLTNKFLRVTLRH